MPRGGVSEVATAPCPVAQRRRVTSAAQPTQGLHRESAPQGCGHTARARVSLVSGPVSQGWTTWVVAPVAAAAAQHLTRRPAPATHEAPWPPGQRAMLCDQGAPHRPHTKAQAQALCTSPFAPCPSGRARHGLAAFWSQWWDAHGAGEVCERGGRSEEDRTAKATLVVAPARPQRRWPQPAAAPVLDGGSVRLLVAKHVASQQRRRVAAKLCLTPPVAAGTLDAGRWCKAWPADRLDDWRQRLHARAVCFVPN